LYAPLYRIIEELGKEIVGGTRIGQQMVNLPLGPKRTKGTYGLVPVHDPIISSMKNAIVYRSIATKTRFASDFFNLVRKAQGGARIAEGPIAKKLRAIDVTTQEVEARLKELLGAERGAQVIKSIKDEYIAREGLAAESDINLGFKIFESLNSPDIKQGIVNIYQDGHITQWKINDGQLLRAFIPQEDFLPKTLKILGAPTRILRAGSVWNPSFIIRNLFRDQFTAAFNSHHGYIPYWDCALGWLDKITGENTKQWREDFMRYGGQHADFVANDKDSLVASLAQIMSDGSSFGKKQGKELMSMAKDAKTATDWLRIINRATLGYLRDGSSFMEEATRTGIFRSVVLREVKKAGLTLDDVLPHEEGKVSTRPDIIEKAIQESKDATLNFSRQGSWGKDYNKIVAFFNANIQDLSKIAREHTLENMSSLKYSKNPIIKGLTWISAPSLLCWMLGRDDEKIQNLPTYRKQLF
jgi:hypothetical protein